MAQVTEVREVTEVQEAEKAPVAERPTQLNNSAPKANPQETAAFEAIRRGLGMSGIKHDDWDFIGNRILDELKKGGILPFGIEDVIRKALPDTQINRRLDVHVHDRGDGEMTPDRALRLTRALSDAYGSDWQLEHYQRTDPRFPAFGALKATIGNTRVCVYFEEIEQ
jgi:hypothetical protein